VVDVLVLNCGELDVSDIISSDRALRVHDPVTDTTVPVIATHATMEKMYGLGEEVCFRLGMQLPDEEGEVWTKMKKHCPEAYDTTVPHWWVAVVVVVEDQGTREKEYTMVHLDLCGAAYDPSSLVMAPGSGTLVSLKVFTTPEYEMIPNTDPDMSHKLIMTPTLSSRVVGKELGTATNWKGVISLQPKSLRHFRCYHKERSLGKVTAASIEVTPLATFIERRPLEEAMNAKISDLILRLQNIHIKNLDVGSKVFVCNIQSKPELNGLSGIIKKATGKDHVASDRIPVLVSGVKKPISLKPSCIQLPPQKQPYRTLEELKSLNCIAEDAQETAEDQYESMSEMQKSQIRNKLDLNDPAVSKVLQSMYSMQTGFTRFADPEYKRGVKELIQPPLCSILPPEALNTFRQSYELSNHPKAGDAIQIINLLKAAKQRLMTEHPEWVLPNGAVQVQPGSEIMRVQASVQKKIRSDAGLAYVFQRLEELGLYMNPARQ
jgi:hypothetical protein